MAYLAAIVLYFLIRNISKIITSVLEYGESKANRDRLSYYFAGALPCAYLVISLTAGVIYLDLLVVIAVAGSVIGTETYYYCLKKWRSKQGLDQVKIYSGNRAVNLETDKMIFRFWWNILSENRTYSFCDEARESIINIISRDDRGMKIFKKVVPENITIEISSDNRVVLLSAKEGILTVTVDPDCLVYLGFVITRPEPGTIIYMEKDTNSEFLKAFFGVLPDG